MCHMVTVGWNASAQTSLVLFQALSHFYFQCNAVDVHFTLIEIMFVKCDASKCGMLQCQSQTSMQMPPRHTMRELNLTCRMSPCPAKPFRSWTANRNLYKVWALQLGCAQSRLQRQRALLQQLCMEGAVLQVYFVRRLQPHAGRAHSGTKCPMSWKPDWKQLRLKMNESKKSMCFACSSSVPNAGTRQLCTNRSWKMQRWKVFYCNCKFRSCRHRWNKSMSSLWSGVTSSSFRLGKVIPNKPWPCTEAAHGVWLRRRPRQDGHVVGRVLGITCARHIWRHWFISLAAEIVQCGTRCDDHGN